MRKGFKKHEWLDLRGRTFGGYLVLDQEPEMRTYKNGKQDRLVRWWNVQCVHCGAIRQSLEGNLVRNRWGCPGCVRKQGFVIATERNRKWPDSGVGSLYTSYRRGAETKNLRFNITYDFFQSLIIQDCVYCGAHPKLMVMTGNGRHRYTVMANGVDRKNNDLGYIEENCVPCCGDCNYEKRDWTERRVYKFFPHLRPGFVTSEVMLYL